MFEYRTRSFIARLYTLSEGYERRVGVTIASTPSLSGWLKAMEGKEEYARPVNFRFDFLERVLKDIDGVKDAEERMHYTISCSSRTGGYRHAKLGQSRNGYAGLYEVATVSNGWKAEPLNDWDDDQNLQFRIRDHLGYILSQHRYVGPYEEELLNARQGKHLIFKAQVLKWL